VIQESLKLVPFKPSGRILYPSEGFFCNGNKKRMGVMRDVFLVKIRSYFIYGALFQDQYLKLRADLF
jgi:hypothetical protein